jgi:dihydropteroate synthase
MLFRARQFEFAFPRPTVVMGIVNVTPDSFSDGGKFFETGSAVAHALELAGQGAEILDIGGESTRPGAGPVSEVEELRRVVPVIEKLAAELKSQWGEGTRQPRLISIDTVKPAVARAALKAGACIVNDVASRANDRREVPSASLSGHADAMWQVVSDYHAGYIAMHAQGTPQTMQANPVYTDVVREVRDFFQERLERLRAAGIAAEQVVFDPGIGFGKTLEHNLQLLANLRSFTTLPRPILLGVSRKSFIRKLLGAEVNARLPASLACATLAIEAGVQLIRTHDVAETVQAIRMAEAMLSVKKIDA